MLTSGWTAPRESTHRDYSPGYNVHKKVHPHTRAVWLGLDFPTPTQVPDNTSHPRRNCGSCCEEESWFVVGLNPLRYAAVVASKRCSTACVRSLSSQCLCSPRDVMAAVYEWLTYFQFSSSLVNGSAPLPSILSAAAPSLALLPRSPPPLRSLSPLRSSDLQSEMVAWP